MIQRRNIYLLLAGIALIVASLACGLGAAPEESSPEMTAPAAEEPPFPEPTSPGEPVFEVPTQVVTIPTSLPPVIGGLKYTPTPHIDQPPDGVFPTQPAVEQTAQPAILESRRLTLEFPPVVRTGDSVRVRFQLEVDDQGNITPTAIVDGNVIVGEVVEIPNLYETHNVIAEARLDMAGMDVQPSGTVSEPLSQGQPALFFWSIRAEESGSYEGTVWLHLYFVPRNGGEESRIPVSVQFIEVEARSFLGLLDGSSARGIGAIGSVAGTVLGFPFMDDLVKWLWRRIRNK